MSSPASEASPIGDKEQGLQEQLDEYGLYLEDDHVVNWHETSPDHPRNWPLRRKLNTTIVIIFQEWLMTFISTSGTTAADQAQAEYGYSSTLGYFAFVSVYLLAQAAGGILLGPVSEHLGRKSLYCIAALIYCIANIVIAAPHSFVAVFFGRFFSGFVSSIAAVVAFGSFDDMFDAGSRIWVVYFYALFGNTGLVLGPIYAIYLSQAIGWRWIFWIAAIASGVSVPVSFAMLSETKASSLLSSRVKELRKQTGHDLRAPTSARKFSLKNFLTESIYRPLFFLFTEPIVCFCAILCSIAFALFYGETESLTIVYTNANLSPAPFSEASSSLAFIAVLVGLLLDAIPRFYDARLLKHRDTPTPELKIHSFAVACPALTIGLWIFGWTVPPRVLGVHWVVSMIGLALTGFAANDFAVVLFGYITDSYGQYAASAASTLSLTRLIAAAVFPLFTTQMYEGLGANIATTILASVSTVFAFTPILFIGYGRTLRRKSKWAITVEGEDKLDEEGVDESANNDKDRIGAEKNAATGD